VALRLEHCYALDPGRSRQNNEDAVLVDSKLGLYLLADGMGGYNAGEVASELAVQTLLSEMQHWASGQFPSPQAKQLAAHQALVRAAQEANQVVYMASVSKPELNGMGTTLVLAMHNGPQVLIGHIGDSRAYRFRHDRLQQLSRDHSLLQEQLDAGLLSPEDARHAAHRNLVTRAVGVEPDVELEVHEHALMAGDLLLLCSDGLTDMVADSDIALLLRSNENLQIAAKALITAANLAGGRDNISVILVRASAIQGTSVPAAQPNPA
jgi:serine/threonine protein phosphatase PrpC